LAAIVESSDDAIISVGLGGLVASWNHAAERLFGYSAAEMIGQPIVRLAAPGYEAEMMALRDRIGRGDRVDHYETVRRHKDGRILHVSLTESPLYGPDGQLTGASKVVRDMTQAKATAAALDASRARLQELNNELLQVSRLSALGQMAAMVTHELNQPLTAISNYMEAAGALIERGGASLPRLRTVVERTGEQAVRAGQIIQRLRGLAARGESTKRIEPVPPLLQEVLELALIGIRPKGIAIALDGNLPDVSVLADKIQIQQVVLNLLRNGAEAVSDQSDGTLAISVEVREGELQIGVADNGPGLPEEVRARLFQPFVSTKETGMGLGLSICHTIIGAHNGRLWAEANPTGGTIFSFALPLAPPAAAAPRNENQRIG
jgi:two-component system sensor kinase FixL